MEKTGVGVDDGDGDTDEDEDAAAIFFVDFWKQLTFVILKGFLR